MSSRDALCAELSGSDKVRAYLVASADGLALASEGIADPESAASSAALCMIQLTALEGALGLGGLRQATFSSSSRNDMLLLRSGQETLAVFKKPSASTTELTAWLRELGARLE